MYTHPLLHRELARERVQENERRIQQQALAQPTESVLDAVVRQLRQLVNARTLRPLARGAS